MKKLINDPLDVVDETLEGIVLAYPNHLKRCEGSHRALMRADGPVEGKVAIVTGGGSGHIPVFLGYVGPGLLDAVSIGQVFSSPSPGYCLGTFSPYDRTRACATPEVYLGGPPEAMVFLLTGAVYTLRCRSAVQRPCSPSKICRGTPPGPFGVSDSFSDMP